MADWPRTLPPNQGFTRSISTYHQNSVGAAIMGWFAAAAWPAANLAIYVPFRVLTIETIHRLACSTGTGTTGNFDLGIYDRIGTRLVSTGSTAKTTASSERVVDVTDTVVLPAMYYLAMAVDDTGNYGMGQVQANVGLLKLSGAREEASAFPLPSTATFGSLSTALRLPRMGAYFRSEA